MYTYDWLLSLSEEVEMVRKAGWSWSICIYFISRYVRGFVSIRSDDLMEPRGSLSVFGLVLIILISVCKSLSPPRE